MFVNDTDAVVDGIPAHGVEVLILAPTIAPTTDQELANAVWLAVGAGIATGGTTTETVRDSSNNDQSVSFTRPEAISIYVSATVYYDPEVWTSSTAAVDVENAAKSAIMNFARGYGIGVVVRSSPISAAIEDGAYAVDTTGAAVLPAPAGSPSIPGIVEVRNGAGVDGTLPYIDKAVSPVTSTTVVITKRQIATITDPTHLVITTTSETPQG